MHGMAWHAWHGMAWHSAPWHGMTSHAVGVAWDAMGFGRAGEVSNWGWVGWVVMVKSRRAASLQAQPTDGRTALHWAARNGHLRICQLLVQKGCDPNRGTHDGTRPLHWAIWQGRLPVAAWLVDVAGADLHAINSYGCNAIQWAAQADPDHGIRTCRWLQRRGLDLALLNRNGHSALHKAAVKGRCCTFFTCVCKWQGVGRAGSTPGSNRV